MLDLRRFCRTVGKVKQTNDTALAARIAEEKYHNCFFVEYGVVWLDPLNMTLDEFYNDSFEYPMSRVDEDKEDEILLKSYLYKGAVVTLIKASGRIKITSYKCNMVHPIGFVHEPESENPILELTAPVGIKFVSRLLTVIEELGL